MENTEKPLSPFKSTFMRCLFEQDYFLNTKKARFAREYINTFENSGDIWEAIKHTQQLQDNLHPGSHSDLYHITNDINRIADGIDISNKTYGAYPKPRHELIDAFYILDEKAAKAEALAAQGAKAAHFQKLHEAAHKYHEIELKKIHVLRNRFSDDTINAMLEETSHLARKAAGDLALEPSNHEAKSSRPKMVLDYKEIDRLDGELEKLVEGLDIGYKTYSKPPMPKVHTIPPENYRITDAERTLGNVEKGEEGIMRKLEAMSAGKKWTIGGAAAAAIAAGGWVLYEHNRKKDSQSDQQIKK